MTVMSDLDQLYQQVILDHSKRKTGCGHVGDMAPRSHQVNPTCGDEVTLTALVSDGGQITRVIWEGDGCSISQASLSIMSELVENAEIARVRELYQTMDKMMHSRGRGIEEEELDLLEDAAALEGTSKFANRIKCSLLGWIALRDVMAQLGFDLEKEDEK